MQLEPGTLVGDRYAIEAPVSAGAMGAVYRARDIRGDGRVAVKQLLDRRHALRVEIEARLLRRLRHPRIVRFLDHVVEGDAGVFLVMDLVEGEDLEQVARRRGGRLHLDEAVQVVVQAAEALHYVHGENTVHRDVKPRNLVLGPGGVVLVDFGIAREASSHSGTAAVGTPGFMAPEVLTGTATPRSDVYGLAATLWTLLAGRPPRIGEAAADLGALGPAAPSVGPALAAALEVDPARRLPSAAGLAAAVGHPLDGVAQGESLAASTGEGASGGLLEAIVRTTAGILDASAVSLALRTPPFGELVYEAAWGAGADEVTGMRLPVGRGIAGAVVESGTGDVIPSCRSDPRFAAAVAERTGYVPNTMVVAPLLRDGAVIGVLAALDRRDGSALGPMDLERLELLAELTVEALGVSQPDGGLGPTLAG